MTDAELIKAVAERLGLVKLKSEKLAGIWKYPNDELENPSVWLTSVDAALSVLDKKKPFSIDWMPDMSWRAGYMLSDFTAEAESLPRAILEAFLEVGG